jgi:transcriptional regulator with XRE-family HTH domain
MLQMHAPSPARQPRMRISDDDTTRRSIKVWMREVLHQKGWTANEWATKAGTSATNITRFLQPESRIVPTASTLAKLVRVAGSQPRLGYIQELNPATALQIPLVTPQLLNPFSPSEFWKWLMSDAARSLATVAVEGPFDGPAVAVDVPDAGMVGKGILPTDRVVVEKLKTCPPGCVILLHHDGHVRIGELHGPVVVFYPPAADGNRPEYRPLRSSDVEIYGRVARLIRDL